MGLASDAERERLLREVRVIALTDVIPNDVCCARKGFSPKRWQRVEAALQRVATTTEGRKALFDLLGATGVEPTNDAALDGFRRALREAGVTAETLLKAAEEKLKGGS